MVWDSFKSYYYTPNAVAWLAWDPELQHRDQHQAAPDEIINIPQAAVRYQPPAALSKELDGLITLEMYNHLIGENLDELFLNENGFYILKDLITRVVFHEDFPDWLIKIGSQKSRVLPMESTVKSNAANREGRKEDAWRPLRNLNLLRASGREYFVTQLEGLEEGERAFFDFPEEYIYTCPHALLGAPDHQKYFSISARKQIHSGDETVEIIKSQEISVQCEVARKIIQFIKLTRIHDWHKENLVLRKDLNRWCFAIIDSEPIGILMESKDTGANLFNSEEHVLIGLICFRDRYCRTHGLTAMGEVADQAIVDYLQERPAVNAHVEADLSFVDPIPATTFQQARMTGLVLISIICPLIPLVLLILAILATYCCPEEDPSDPFNRFGSIDLRTPGRESRFLMRV